MGLESAFFVELAVEFLTGLEFGFFAGGTELARN